MNPLDIEKIHVMMDGLVHGNGSAKCAVDIALHDLKGKVMGQPLYRVLGGYQDVVQNDITTVSYTHLDVYKRQLSSRRASHLCGGTDRCD